MGGQYMTKKIKYKITEKKFIWIEVESNEIEELVEELNRNIEATSRKEKRHNKFNVSIDRLYEVYDFEFASNEPSIFEVITKKEESKRIWEAIYKLTTKQQQVIIEHFWNNKSLNSIAKDRGVSSTAIKKIYHSSLVKLKRYLKNNIDF